MPSGTKVEDTYSSELTELLKKRGLNATFKKSYTTLAGRREPDITVQLPEGIALIEAKSPPAGLTKAMSQVNEYRQSVGATERITAVFAVVYSNGIKKEIEVYYSNEHDADFQKFKSLEKFAEFIFEKTQEKPSEAAAPQPISTQKVIAILNDNVGSIRQSLSKASAEDIEGLFGGRDFFSTVLDYEQEEHVSDAALKNAAAQAKAIVDEATRNAEAIRKEGELSAKDLLFRMRQDFEKETRERREEIASLEKRMSQREANLDRRVDLLEKKER